MTEKRLRLRSHWVSYAFLAGGFVTLLAHLLGPFLAEPPDLSMWRDHVAPAPLTFRHRLMIVAAGLPLGLIEAVMFIVAARLFSAFSNGDYFGSLVTTSMRRLGLALMLLPATQIITKTAMTLWFTWELGPGNRELTIGANNSHLTPLLMGVALALIADTQSRAQRALDENKQIV